MLCGVPPSLGADLDHNGQLFVVINTLPPGAEHVVRTLALLSPGVSARRRWADELSVLVYVPAWVRSTSLGLVSSGIGTRVQFAQVNLVEGFTLVFGGYFVALCVTIRIELEVGASFPVGLKHDVGMSGGVSRPIELSGGVGEVLPAIVKMQALLGLAREGKGRDPRFGLRSRVAV